MAVATPSNSIQGKLFELNWLLPMLIFLVGCIGVIVIYSATGGVWDLGASRHLLRLFVGMGFLLVVAMTNIRVWMALAYPAYLIALALLIGVEFFGVSVNGSQRWIDLGITRMQPSEFMKMAMVLALARFYHDLPQWRVSKPVGIIVAAGIIFIPVILIINQPDLGTSLLLMATGIVIIFLAGINWRIILTACIAAAIAIPLFFMYGLKEYQRSRVLTFLDPERDPTGASYHIIQSKIALGSGGVNGKGFLQGSQASLNYVPENRTDFVFTVIGEEFGLIGGLGTMSLYILIIAVCFWLANQCRTLFPRMLILGLTTTFTLYIFINLAMVMGLAPVVGVPLPLISYGGTVMFTVMAGFGMILSAHLHRETKLPRGSGLLL
ncbi:MAG: rod shape-determining protein RodA [Acidimicrobiales bacterium]|nr:rod shape-determining protein RodA [Hyphomonadaceae bacterium]RZV41623.1 MAG: rod shape-determining protein RodA [Acidimicrobiales bacterium]